MISTKIKSNLLLFLTILSAIAFYSYYISKNKGSIKIEDSKKTIQNKNPNFNSRTTIFTNVEYKSTDEKNRVFITKGKEASISKEFPNLVQLDIVHSYTTIKDGSVLNIKSNKAKYFKNTQNIEYYETVKITNKDVIITSKSAKFQKNKNKIRLEKDVVFKSPESTIKSDIAEIDIITNNLEIFMKKKKDKVYGRREKN